MSDKALAISLRTPQEQIFYLTKERDELAARVKVLEDALREIADAAEDHWLYNFARKALEERR